MGIKSEGATPNAWIYIDVKGIDVGTYVQMAQRPVNEAVAKKQVTLPSGYNVFWNGQYEYMQRAKQRLAVVIPITLLIIVLIIYLNTRSFVGTAIIMLSVPLALVGSFWMLYLLGYNLSVAVWVGLLALAGLDAETGGVMLLYLDHAWEKFRAEGRMKSIVDLRAAIHEGAVQRLRPKIMTACAILFGLLPIMWSPITQTGADLMKRIATPMIGGVVTSALLELLVYPVIFLIWKKRGLKEQEEETPFDLMIPE
jgi:Cu(I)/Ag(I) efflux system membrane protein CusA/SilA